MKFIFKCESLHTSDYNVDTLPQTVTASRIYPDEYNSSAINVSKRCTKQTINTDELNRVCQVRLLSWTRIYLDELFILSKYSSETNYSAFPENTIVKRLVEI